MRILVTGGTGFIGQHLIAKLPQDSQITVLSRRPEHAKQLFGARVTALQALPESGEFEHYDAVINLAGEPIADKRWSPQQKRKICDSRWQLTEQLASAIATCTNPPVFISGSAIGFYGDQQQRPIDESSDIDQHTLTDDFAHQVCAEWEQRANRVSQHTRVCIVRTGIVLAPGFGALKKMLPAYRLGLGGPMGSGQQFMSWIHIDDMVNLLLFLLNNNEASGIYNATAPNPVSNRQFSSQLAATLHRPHLFFTPAFVLKLAFGEMANLLLTGQQVKPTRLLDAGFQFQFADLTDALEDLLRH
ncbi:TIGR01777 family protein [Neiella sp. HB171785]|uniref:TIGR01777 family protein n=1 Tax=Neiella litorisoli TaxID=2771431 RepID=A0A8J6QVL5_9GAMM|nr:TIGR01777 family oxidoreductase [Neiella litorisoli]MBD1390673.1 TIGR01777 family protein [Neiella litorisoli]